MAVAHLVTVPDKKQTALGSITTQIVSVSNSAYHKTSLVLTTMYVIAKYVLSIHLQYL